MSARLVGLLLLLGLAACGFRPLYGDPDRGGAGTTPQLGEIIVNPKPKRDGKHSDGYLTSQQLDELPYPAYELFPIHERCDLLAGFGVH